MEGAGQFTSGSDSELRILITNMLMTGRTGTEVVTRDLALGLLRRGHKPVVYTPAIGPIGEEVRRAGIPVFDNVFDLSENLDLIHAHHLGPCAAALDRFPKVPAIFVCHDATAWHDAPPRLPSIRRHVAVSEVAAARLVSECCISPDGIEIILNGADTDRFLPGKELSNRPTRALAFARHPKLIQPVREACAAMGLTVDIVGYGVGAPIDRPEQMIPDYDLVFASGLTALEAMACRRAVIC